MGQVAPLRSIEQCIVLGQCICEKHSQAEHALRTWNMQPFVECLLQQAKARPLVRREVTLLIARHERHRPRYWGTRGIEASPQVLVGEWGLKRRRRHAQSGSKCAVTGRHA